MDCDDVRENAKNTLPNIQRELRSQLVRDDSNASLSEIEAKVLLRMQRGMKPTTSTITPPPGIPKDVQETREVARRAVVKKGKLLRRGGR